MTGPVTGEDSRMASEGPVIRRRSQIQAVRWPQGLDESPRGTSIPNFELIADL